MPKFSLPESFASSFPDILSPQTYNLLSKPQIIWSSSSANQGFSPFNLILTAKGNLIL